MKRIAVLMMLLLFAAAAVPAWAEGSGRYAGCWTGTGAAEGERFVIRADGRFVRFAADGTLDTSGTLETGTEEIGGTEHRTVRLKDEYGKLDGTFYDDEAAESTAFRFGNGDAPDYVKAADAPETALPLPAYEYAGGDELLAQIISWMRAQAGEMLAPGDVWIPAPVVYLTDGTDPRDIRVIGNFWSFTYDLYGTCLVTVSGGEMPAVFHFEEKDGAPVLKDVEVAGEGEEYAEDVRRFCEGYEGLAERMLLKTEEEREQLRLDFIRGYRDRAGLDIRTCCDPFWAEKAL